MSSQYYFPRTGKPYREYRSVIDLFWKQTVVESNASNNSEINFVPDFVHCLDSVWTMDRPANNLDHCAPTAIENQESLCFSPPPTHRSTKFWKYIDEVNWMDFFIFVWWTECNNRTLTDVWIRKDWSLRLMFIDTCV